MDADEILMLRHFSPGNADLVLAGEHASVRSRTSSKTGWPQNSGATHQGALDAYAPQPRSPHPKTMSNTILKETALFLLSMTLSATTARSADVTGPYFGQTPPGPTPQTFAPGIISMTNRSGGRIAFSPDGTECYFTTMNADWTNWRIYYTQLTNGAWTTPELAPFSVSQQTGQPFFSRDGNKLYFTSSPNPQGYLYVVNRTPQGWSNSVPLPSPIYSGSGEWSYSQAADGTAYFVSQRSGGYGGMDLYQTYLDTNQTLRVRNLGVLNSGYNERAACIAPDGTYLIFSSARAGTYEQNLYVSFTNGIGGWTSPIDLNVYCPGINTGNADEHEPSLSPDGKYLFFDREGAQGGVYWVENPVIPKLAISLADTNVNLFWSTNFPGFALESTDELAGAWTPVPGVTGFSATIPVTAEGQFFRLRK